MDDHMRRGGPPRGRGRWLEGGPGGPRWGRMRRGDIRTAVLAILAEEPGHGYEVMQRLEEKSGGAWRPSPGSVYPMLQLLEDEGLVRSTERDGKRVFEVTDAGVLFISMKREDISRHFVAPGLAWLIQTARGAAEYGIKPGSPLSLAYERELEHAVETCRKMHRRGIRVLIGGDYGFARTPQGENARDIEHFVRHLGYSPSEALVCATRYGAELMGLGGEAGQVREGFLADLLLVDGDPVADVGLLQRRDRLVAILKGGTVHKLDRAALERREVRAAE